MACTPTVETQRGSSCSSPAAADLAACTILQSIARSNPPHATLACAPKQERPHIPRHRGERPERRADLDDDDRSGLNETYRFVLRQSVDKDTGVGVYALSDIPADAFVMEYDGELLSNADAQQKERDYAQMSPSPGCYMFYFHFNTSRIYCIDATAPARDAAPGTDLPEYDMQKTSETQIEVSQWRGYGIGRYVNHASLGKCNLRAKVENDSTRCNTRGRAASIARDRYPVLRFFSSRHIVAGEELTIDYADRRLSTVKHHKWLALASDVETSLDDSEPETTIVLGMANINNTYANSVRLSEGVTSAALRDQSRLRWLGRVLAEDARIITFDENRSPADCLPCLHYQGRWTRLSADGLFEQFGENVIGVRDIFCDYIRFPSDYRRESYSILFKETLSAFVSRGIIDSTTQVIVPYYDGIMQDVAQYRPPPSTSLRMRCDSISCKEYHLFLATQYLEQAIARRSEDDVMGGQSNERDGNVGDSPFLRFTFTQS